MLPSPASAGEVNHALRTSRSGSGQRDSETAALSSPVGFADAPSATRDGTLAVRQREQRHLRYRVPCNSRAPAVIFRTRGALSFRARKRASPRSGARRSPRTTSECPDGPCARFRIALVKRAPASTRRGRSQLVRGRRLGSNGSDARSRSMRGWRLSAGHSADHRPGACGQLDGPSPTRDAGGQWLR